MKVISDPSSMPIELAFPFLRVMSLISKPMGEDPVHRQLADEGIIDKLFDLMKFWFADKVHKPFQDSHLKGRFSFYTRR